MMVVMQARLLAVTGFLVASIAGLLLGGLLYASFGSRVFLVSAILVALTCGLSLWLPAQSSAKDE